MLKLYQPNWSWGEDTDKWLNRIFEGKSILNFPCGKSNVGYRVDADKSVNPEILADLDNHPFKHNSFDVVICDPPFSKYSRFKWLTKLSKIAKTDLLISTPYMRPYISNFKLEHTWLSQRDSNFYLRLWLHFKKKNGDLTLYE